MKEEKQKYFNFPIQLLEGFMTDHKCVLSNILDYAVFAGTIDLLHGTELVKLKCSADYFSVIMASPSNTLSNGKMLHESLSENSPRVGLSLPIFWDFYKNEKTDFEKGCFLAFLSIKSIIGDKSYYRATNLYLWARMDGKAKAIVEVGDLSSEVRKFANEYQTKKIKTALRNSWGLIQYARYTKGFYVSFKMTLRQLMTEAEKQKASAIEKHRIKQEKELLKEVLEELKRARP